MTPPRALVAAALLALALSSCSSDDDGGTAAADQSAQPPQSAPSTPSDAQLASQEAAGGEAPEGGVSFVDAVDDPAATIRVGADGLDPGETTVPVGSVVRVRAGDAGSWGVVVNDLPSYTVTRGLDEFFRFEEPGTYAVTEDSSGATATITAD